MSLAPRIGLVAIALGIVVVTHASAQVSDEERPKVEAEAKLQAEEADKLFASANYLAALPLYQAERGSRLALGDLRYEALATRAVGCCLEKLGQIDEAISAWREALVLDAKREDTGFEGYDHLLIGKAEYHRGKLDPAEKEFQASIPLFSKAVDADHECEARFYLGRLRNDQEAFAEAYPHLIRAFDLIQTVTLEKLHATLLGELGRASRGRGEFGLAAEWLVDASMRADDAHQSTDVAWANRLLGDVFMELGRHDVAAARVEAAVAIHRELDDQTLLADDLCFLASVALNDDPAKARQFAEQAVKAATAAEDLELMVDAHVHLALAKSELNDFAGATESIDQALNLVKGLNDEHEHIRILLVAASLNAKAGRLEIARRHADTARTLAERSADPVMHRLFPTKTP